MRRMNIEFVTLNNGVKMPKLGFGTMRLPTLEGERFTVCFFPEEKRQDLGYLGMHSGHNEPDKINHTTLTPKLLDNAVGFEEATLTFVCKKIYTHLMGKDELPEFVRDTLYRDGDLHYIFMGEIEDVFGTIDE